MLRPEFKAGRLSYSKIRALTRIAEPDNEADLTELAASATAAQIERTVASWRRVETLTDDERLSRQDLYWHFDEHGMLHFAGCLDTEDAAIVLAALEAITGRQATEQAQQPVDQPADEALPEASPRGRFQPPGPTPPSRAAALVGLAKAFLNSDRDADGPRPRLRRARLHRTPNLKLHAHHIWHWADGGPTYLDNLILLCKTHHHLLHHGAFTITSSGGRFVLSDEAGAVIEPVPAQTIAAEPLAAADLESIPTWAGGHGASRSTGCLVRQP